MNRVIILAFMAIAFSTPGFAEEPKKSAVDTPAPQHFMLVCSSQLLKKTITVDLAKKTIDGKAASFSETTIAWRTEEVDAVWKRPERQAVPKRYVLHEINRLEGVYRTRDEGASMEGALAYNCEKAPQQKF